MYFFLEYIGKGKDIKLPEGCTNCRYMFSYYRGHVDLSKFKTDKVTGMEGMFKGYTGVLDLSNFNTSKVINMDFMFSKVNALFLDLSNFDTSSVRSMTGMFKNFKGDLDLSSFNTRNVLFTDSMFGDYRCNSLDLDLSSFDLSRVEDMSYMFDDAVLLHRGSRKLVGIRADDLVGYIRKYKLLGLEMPTFYRKDLRGLN